MFRHTFRRSVTRAYANTFRAALTPGEIQPFNWLKFWSITAGITVVLVAIILVVVNPILEWDLYRQSKDNGIDAMAGPAPRTWIGEPLLKTQFGLTINTRP